ncbi:PASTA domain-containing protein [Haliangium sp. UPWRP_2]|uniref:PASTA domain-containing protein n=1 Tax=Haliangium sp. UPWRP_2 TaxID=1931276 RepID=UPI000B53ED64|nr:PASTA domain-containing protein [Haliangium sp. UPWRP_2]PSM30953.1 PASTA domain-containing protein [Haliangium sp. UPWRP_2]
MSAWQHVVSGLVSMVVSAGTYLVMHNLMAPPPEKVIDVPQIVGLTPDQARGLAEPMGLLLVIDGQRESESDKIAVGSVMEQRPLQGSRLKKGGELHAMLALPVAKVAVPAVVGQPLAAAQKAIADLGLKAGAVTEVPNVTVPVGAIIATEPPPGSQLRRGESVSLQVSKGGEQVQVPSLRGRGLGSARRALEQAGLVLGDVGKTSDDNAADGAVLRQDPAPGTAVAKGSKVNVVVND